MLRRLWDWLWGWQRLSHMVFIEYLNYRGEFSKRTIFPRKVWYGKTKHHPQPQWFLEAYDCDKRDYRTFAIRDIREWI